MVSNRTETQAPAEAAAPVKREKRGPDEPGPLGEDRRGWAPVSNVAPGTEKKDSEGELFRTKPDKMPKTSKCYVNVKTTYEHFYKKSFSRLKLVMNINKHIFPTVIRMRVRLCV